MQRNSGIHLNEAHFLKCFLVLFHLGTIPNVLVTFFFVVRTIHRSTPSVSYPVSCVMLFIPKSPSNESEHWSFLERLFCSFVSLLLSRLHSHQPASLRQAVCKGTSQLAWPRLINDERQAGFQVHKSHSVESRSAASPKPVSWQKSEVPGASQIP